MIILKKKENLYLASLHPDLSNGFLEPEIPRTVLANHKSFDYRTPRICFYPSIDMALSSLGRDLSGRKVYIYSPLYVNQDSVYHPSILESPGVQKTGETWVLEKIRVKLVKTVLPDDIYEKQFYVVGPGSKVTLNIWNWEDLSIPKKKSKSLYYVSPELKPSLELIPHVPDNYMTKNGFEDSEKRRVMFSRDIPGALMALSRDISDQVLYAYCPSEKVAVYSPNQQEVPDVDITHEVWSDKKVRVYPKYKILVKDSTKPGLSYTYGHGRKAMLYPWNYKLEKI